MRETLFKQRHVGRRGFHEQWLRSFIKGLVFYSFKESFYSSLQSCHILLSNSRAYLNFQIVHETLHKSLEISLCNVVRNIITLNYVK